VTPAFRALAPSFVPETAGASVAEWAALESTVDAALARRPAALRRQIALFLALLDLWARLRYRAPLARLDPARRSALLEGFARSPLLLFRRGIWGLRTLVMMGWYTQDGVMAALGYRARAEGWETRR
jgi:hypothetical protein